MATTNTLYDSARQQFLEGNIDWINDTIKCCIVTSAYTLNASLHAHYQDLGGAVINSPVTLTSKSTAGGAADAADVTFPAVGAGTVVDAIVVYKDTGSPSTSPLLAYLGNATGLPITGNGGDIIIVWDSGVNKIFRV